MFNNSVFFIADSTLNNNRVIHHIKSDRALQEFWYSGILLKMIIFHIQKPLHFTFFILAQILIQNLLKFFLFLLKYLFFYVILNSQHFLLSNIHVLQILLFILVPQSLGLDYAKSLINKPQTVLHLFKLRI